MAKLNQLLSIEKNVKNKREDELTKLYQDVQKPDLLNGFSKTYQAKTENGDVLPPQTKKVQVKAEETLKLASKALIDIFDVVAQKDATNCKAAADVIVEGQTIMKNVPAVHLLFIEKKLVDLGQFMKKLPTLSQDESWEVDAAQGLYRTAPVEVISTKKVEDFKVIVPPTKEHPAQTVKVVEDIAVGSWKTVKFSGALPVDRIRELQERVDKLTRAVKYAREEANQTPAVELKTGDAAMKYIFG